MSSKEDMSPPLKLLNNFYCTNCNVQFTIRDLTWKASRYPMLLQCGHSVCESCLQQYQRSLKSISCQECNFISSLPTEEQGTECFPHSIYELGRLVAIQTYKQEKDKRLAVLTKNSGNFNYSLKRPNLQDSNKNVCEECPLVASWYCDNCKSNFCEMCWSKVHGSAKSLMKHCKTALSSTDSLKNGLMKKCSIHEAHNLEFYCTGCSIAICSHCFLQQHQGAGHCPVTLKEKNIEIISEVKTAVEEAEVIKKRMKQTLEKIKLTQNSCEISDHNWILDFQNQIMKSFSRIHGILQLEEERHLKMVHDIANEREDRLKDLSKLMETQLENVESLLSQCEHAVKTPQTSDLTDLHRQLKDVKNLPCYLISRKPEQGKQAKITFDEKLVDLIRTYCSMDVPSSETFELSSGADLPEGYAVEPLDYPDSNQELKFVPKTCPDSYQSDVDTLSNCSSREVTRSTVNGPSPSITPSPSWSTSPPKTFCEGRNYSVRVTYIKNPGEFYVMLNSQRPKQLAIEKKAYQFASSSCVIPGILSKDELYLVRYEVDKKWYRGRIVEKSARKIDGKECVVIYYLDYGNTEVVPLSRLRVIPADIKDEPPLAVKCKLFDCVPKNGEWCDQSTKTMEKILVDYMVTMFVMKIHQDFMEVDLSVIYPENQIGRGVVSVRDTLMLLDFASFVNGTKIPQNATVMKYPHQCLPAIGELFDAVVTHVNSPSDFYIQRTLQDTSYLYNLTVDLQNYYSENSHKGIIYDPLVGMPCAALFSADNKWYRAKIVNIPNRKTVTVYYVDYGNRETIPSTQIRKLKECFIERPPLALSCSLAGIFSTENEWHTQARSYLEKCVLVRDCIVKVHSRPKHKPKLKVLLYKRVNNREVCVNTLFVEMGYAAKSNSLWVSKARERAEPTQSNVALDDEQSVSDTENESVRGPGIFTERKRSKLKAQKLRELHENKKKNNGSVLPAEGCENESDGFDDLFKMKVEVLSAESPSSVYVTFPALKEEFKILQMKLNEFYKDSACDATKEWVAGSTCAVYHSSKSCWYRASVLQVLPDNDVKVFLKDIAVIATEPASSLRELEDSFTKFATCAVKCHLADIEPPGEQWPSISSEYLINELDNYKELYMTKKVSQEKNLDWGQIINKSLPIELWVKRIISSGALEPTAKEWITLNKVLVNQGLAVPKESKSWYGGIASDEEEDSDAGTVPLAAVKSHPEKKVSEKPAEDSDAFVPPVNSRWLPPEPLKRNRFVGVPTYVDSDASIYIHDAELDEDKLTMMCDSLLEEYADSKPGPEDVFYSPGQLCIARYHVDNSWYRGLIVRIHENVNYDVLFVDYGNVETCQASDLRKAIKMQEIPIITHKFRLQGIEPVSQDRKWPVSVLEILHSLVVEKKCEVNVLKPPPDPSEAYIISLKIIEDDIDVGTFLVDQNLAVITSPEGESCNTSGPDVCSSDKAPSLNSPKTVADMYVSRYPSLTIPADCKGFFIKVTSLIAENEFFALIVDENSLPPALKDLLQGFEDLQKQLMEEGDSQVVLENLVRGEPCCCLHPESNKWCRGEIQSFSSTENSVCVFYVDHGSQGFVDKDLLHKCKDEWLRLPKMAVRFKLANVERCPAVSKSVYMKTLTDCLKESVPFAEVTKNEEILEVRLLKEANGSLVYQDMISKNMLNFVQ